MASKAFATLNPTLLKKIKSLSKARRVTPDKLLNSAVRAYLKKIKSEQREARELSTATGDLAAYRQRDPGYEQAINAFVVREAGGAATDPVEGKTVKSVRSLRISLDAILHG